MTKFYGDEDVGFRRVSAQLRRLIDQSKATSLQDTNIDGTSLS